MYVPVCLSQFARDDYCPFMLAVERSEYSFIHVTTALQSGLCNVNIHPRRRSRDVL